MNTDMISLICPSCGGKLTVAKQADRLICEHCGTEHIIRRENNGVFLEAYARCPNCGRNDKSKKVSAIIRKESSSGTNASLLSQHLAPPIKPIINYFPPKKRPIPLGIGTMLFIVVFFIFMCGMCLTSAPHGSDGYYISIVSIGIALILLIPSVYFGMNEYDVRKERDLEHKKQIADYFKKYEQEINDSNKLWEQAIKRWDLLYYCERDDCVFITGENMSAPVSQMKDLLYK